MNEFLPVIPEGLVELLRRSFPDKTPRKHQLDAEPSCPYYNAGQQSVIDHIEQHYLQQQEDMRS